jgi:hypothetical protein
MRQHADAEVMADEPAGEALAGLQFIDEPDDLGFIRRR